MPTAHAQKTTPRDVWQDKTRRVSGRTASLQPASDAQVSDRGASATKPPRSQTDSIPSRAKVPFTIHVDPLVKAEVQRQGEINGNSASAEASDLLEAMLRQTLHIQQAATLETTIERIMATSSRRLATQMAYFLVTILFQLGQVKALSTNTLGMQEGVTEELLKNILGDADRRTRGSLSRKNPKLTESIKAVEERLLSGEDDMTATHAPHRKKEGSAPWP